MKKQLAKLFLNEKGEASWRKIGSAIGAIGGFLAFGAIPGAQVLIIGKALVALGVSVVAIGQFDKNDRAKTEE